MFYDMAETKTMQFKVKVKHIPNTIRETSFRLSPNVRAISP